MRARDHAEGRLRGEAQAHFLQGRWQEDKGRISHRHMVRLVGAEGSHEVGTGCRTARCDRLICKKLGEKSMCKSEIGPKGVIFPWKFPETENLKGVHISKRIAGNTCKAQGVKHEAPRDGRYTATGQFVPHALHRFATRVPVYMHIAQRSRRTSTTTGSWIARYTSSQIDALTSTRPSARTVAPWLPWACPLP